MAFQNRFIVIEGLDGSGKSTVSQKLLQTIPNAELFCEPTLNSPYRNRIRSILAGEEGPVDAVKNRTLLDLFLEDRLWNIQHNLKPALEKNKNIVLDRYYFSTAAYQGKDTSECLHILAKYLMRKDILKPDLVIYLKVTPSTALKRIGKRPGSLEEFEKTEFLEKVYKNYESIFSLNSFDFPVQAIEAHKDFADVWADVQKAVSF